MTTLIKLKKSSYKENIKQWLTDKDIGSLREQAEFLKGLISHKDSSDFFENKKVFMQSQYGMTTTFIINVEFDKNNYLMITTSDFDGVNFSNPKIQTIEYVRDIGQYLKVLFKESFKISKDEFLFFKKKTKNRTSEIKKLGKLGLAYASQKIIELTIKNEISSANNIVEKISDSASSKGITLPNDIWDYYIPQSILLLLK